jgi:hypothetical protein
MLLVWPRSASLIRRRLNRSRSQRRTKLVPFAARDKFLHALVAELAVAGAHNPGVVRKIGQRLQARFLGAAPIIATEDRDWPDPESAIDV